MTLQRTLLKNIVGKGQNASSQQTQNVFYSIKDNNEQLQTFWQASFSVFSNGSNKFSQSSQTFCLQKLSILRKKISSSGKESECSNKQDFSIQF